MDKEQFAKVFPLGSHLCREPMPAMSEMKKDMEILKKHGFNLIKLQENWAVDEPLEGFYDFSKYEELIGYAAKLELGIYLGLTMEQAPNWLWRKYPEARMVGRNGLPVAYQAQSTLPGDGKPGPCYDHPGAMEAQLCFIRKLVEDLGKYKNIVVWNTWQEIAYWAEGNVGQHVCYCDNTLRHFQSWLQRKYGDLDSLNRAWNTRYMDWEYVLPDRLNGRVCLPNDIDWKYFMEHIQIGEILKARAAAIKEADPLQRPVFAHKAGAIIGSGVDWTYARTQDFLGSSSYPAWGSGHGWDDVKQPSAGPIGKRDALVAEMWDGVALKFDYIRSCNPEGNPIWAAEFQGGPVSTGFQLGRVPSPGDIRRWMLTAVASGVTAISFWVSRVEIMAAEMNGFGLLDSEGETSARLEEAGRIGRALNKYPQLFGQPSWPGADVAILINDWNYQLCNSLAQGGENLAYSIRGWHRMLWDAGIPVDFVDSTQLDEDSINAYKAILLPFPLSISEELAAKLCAYVKKGGNLISEACPGRLNEHGFASRGELSPVLRELFGVTAKSFQMVREPGSHHRWSPEERTWGEYLEAAVLQGTGALAGHSLRANVYIETFTCEGSAPILTYNGATAGTVRNVEKGKAWLLGTFAGHNGTAYRDTGTREFVMELLDQCGVPSATAGTLLVRKRSAANEEAWIFTNPTDAEVIQKVDVTGWSYVEDLLGDRLVMEGHEVVLAVAPLDMEVLVVKK